jgi:sialic acid synthase SpsE
MSFITLRNGRQIGDYLRPYIVAELNTSHFGKLDIAKTMIEQAKASGCDCVKFQSWSADTLYCESYYQGNKMARRVVDSFSLTDDELRVLAVYAKEVGIDFASTPYSIEEARFLVEECHVPFIKIASMELNNLPYLRQLGQLGAPLVLSTGMGTLAEIVTAVRTIEQTGNRQLAVLHCTSVYPSAPEIVRLHNILGLREALPDYPIGYSDHSLGMAIPAASIALGACLVEKHFTLDSSRIGMDNQMATEPEGMRDMVLACHTVYLSMGGRERVLAEAELAQIPKMRRSIVSKVRLAPGDFLTSDSVDFKRPGTGYPPAALPELLGRQVRKIVERGQVLAPDDFL